MYRDFWSSHLLARGSLSTRALAGQIDAGGVVDDPVQDCVGVGRVADQLVPVLNQHLADHYGRAPSVSVFQDFQQVVTASSIERLENPVVQNQQLRRNYTADQPSKPSVSSGQRQLGKQLRHTLIQNGAVVPAGSMAERLGQPTFAHPGRTAEDQIVMSVDPGTSGQLLNKVRSRPRTAR